MKKLVKIGDVYTNDKVSREKISTALEAQGYTTALQSDTGLIVMETEDIEVSE